MKAVHCSGLEELSAFLGFAPQHLYYLVKHGDQLYVPIRIPKRSDKTSYREIFIPSRELKGVQRAILDHILSAFPTSQNCYSYVKGQSVVDLCNKLCGKKSILEIDIKDFFPSIKFYRVFGLLRSFGFNKECSYIISKLCTCNGSLCQGAPTSPYISNLIMNQPDAIIHKAAIKWNVNYYRYSDNFFFCSPSSFNYKKLSQVMEEILVGSGFALNKDKTRFHRSGKPRITLGLLTHGARPQMRRKIKRQYRAIFFKASRDINWAQQNQNLLYGMLNWHMSVYGRDDNFQSYQSTLDSIKRLKLHDTYQSS
jgi:RNA-directed DNA polymerase